MVDVAREVRITELRLQLAELGVQEPAEERDAPAAAENIAKNKRPSKAGARKYRRISDSLADWGRVPQQQAELADLLLEYMTKDVEYTEAEVFELVETCASEYPAIAKSVQHPTYLLRYYRELKNDGKHAGLVARGFLRCS